MVSTEQYQQAQPEVAASLSTHALQLARFEFELAERNRLLAQVEELKKARDAQQAANLLLSQRVEDITQKFDKVKKDALVVKQLLFDDSLQVDTQMLQLQLFARLSFIPHHLFVRFPQMRRWFEIHPACSFPCHYIICTVLQCPTRHFSVKFIPLSKLS